MARLKSADARTIESDPLDEGVFVDRGRRDAGVLPCPRNVGKSEVDHLDALFLDEVEDLAGFLCHPFSLIKKPTTPQSPSGQVRGTGRDGVHPMARGGAVS